MTREQLFPDIFAAHLEPDDLVYFERCGEDYLWQRLSHDATMACLRPNPDAWIYYSGKWPSRDAECWRAFLNDLLAEMETSEGLQPLVLDGDGLFADDSYPIRQGARSRRAASRFRGYSAGDPNASRASASSPSRR